MVPSIYVLIWDAELVTPPSPNTSNPHFEATDNSHQNAADQWSISETPTEHLVPDLVFPYEIPEQFLIYAGLINDLRSLSASRAGSWRRAATAYSSIPECAPQLNGFQ